jgi:uncharacterized membrane protein YgcG
MNAPTNHAPTSGDAPARPRRNRLLRLLRHRWHDETDAVRALGADGLRQIEQRVAASERRHSGEIRVCVEAGLPLSYLWNHATPRERAVSMFGKLRVWDTEHNNGVLIYLLLAEHAIEIVADRGLARRVEAGVWQGIVAALSAHLKAGRHREGVEAAVDAVSRLLEQHFPLGPGEANPDELPNPVEVR